MSTILALLASLSFFVGSIDDSERMILNAIVLLLAAIYFKKNVVR